MAVTAPGIQNPADNAVILTAWGDAINADLTDLDARTSGAWTSFTPTWTNITIGNGASTGAWKQVGKTLSFRARFVLGNTSSVTGAVKVTLPNGQSAADPQVVTAHYTDSGVGHYSGTAAYNSPTLLELHHATGVVTTAVPFAWTTNDEILVTGVIETT